MPVSTHGQRGPCALLDGVPLRQPLWEAVWRVAQKSKMGLPSDPATPLLGIYPEDTKPGSQRDAPAPRGLGGMFTATQTWRTLSGP